MLPPRGPATSVASSTTLICAKGPLRTAALPVVSAVTLVDMHTQRTRIQYRSGHHTYALEIKHSFGPCNETQYMHLKLNTVYAVEIKHSICTWN